MTDQFSTPTTQIRALDNSALDEVVGSRGSLFRGIDHFRIYGNSTSAVINPAKDLIGQAIQSAQSLEQDKSHQDDVIN